MTDYHDIAARMAQELREIERFWDGETEDMASARGLLAEFERLERLDKLNSRCAEDGKIA